MTDLSMSLEGAVQTKFQGIDRETLEQFASILQVKFDPESDDDQLVKQLNEKVGNLAAIIEPQNKGNQKAIEGVDELLNLNLLASGYWQGRRRMIRLQRQGNAKAPVPFAWQRQPYFVPYEVDVSVPYPVYEVLKNGTTATRLKQQQKQLEDQTLYMETTKYTEQRIPYSNLGDDPETEHLPRSLKEQFQMAAELTNNFSGYDNYQLRKLLAKYTGKPSELYRKWPDEEVRDELLMKVGITTQLAA